MRNLLRYYRRSLIIELKRTVIYPFSFWSIALIWPFYSVLQLIFIQTIFAQTNSFAGYSKNEAFILFGTFSVVQTLGHLIFSRRIAEFAGMIRGNYSESFDIALTRPIDAQIFTTTGRFNIGNISATLLAFCVVLYGVTHLNQPPSWINVISYFSVIPLGVMVYYLVYTFLSIFLFKYPEIQMTENLWNSLQEFGQYPAALYQGGLGLLVNIILPITLMASVPADFLLGRKPIYMVIAYYLLIGVLFLLLRKFWNYSIKRYSSYSS